MNDLRRCSMCGEDKPETDEFFYRKIGGLNGFSRRCIICSLIVSRAWQDKNKERVYIRARARQLRLKEEYRPILEARRAEAAATRPERKKAYHKGWVERNAAKHAEYKHEWYLANKGKNQPVDRDKFNKWRRDRLANDPIQRVHSAISRGMRSAITFKKNGVTWQKLVGYSTKELRRHLERQFTSEMTWDNYGSYWEIDHILPLSMFGKASSADDPLFKMAWALANLRPLSCVENKEKSDRRLFLI